jgi:Flp pilus assembly protein TadG
MRIPPSLSRDANSGRLRSPIRHRNERGQSIVEFALVLPLMMIILLAIIDFGRIYTTMMTVESAAREGADFATTLGAEHWDPATYTITEAEMERRSCVAASNLPDYVGDAISCTNPSFDYCLTTTSGGPCLPYDPTAGCENPDRVPPCLVTVTLTYDFHLFAPVVGLPTTLTFDRDSTFAMTDIDLAPTPTP